MYYDWFWWSFVWLIPMSVLLWLVFSWNARRTLKWAREAGRREAYYPGLLHDGKRRGRGPRNYTRADSRIAEDVNDQLLVDEDLDPADVGVEVQEGVVTLCGTVESRADKVLAETLADAVAGVRDVHNQLTIRAHGVASERKGVID